MKIGIVGGGVVGRATARCWHEYVEEVRVYDLIPERRTSQLLTVLSCDLVFICLPAEALEGFFGNVKSSHPINFVIKSTVPIGTTRRLRDKFNLRDLVHSPEFLTERCAMTDAQMPARNIVGIPSWGNGGLSEAAANLIGLLESRFLGVQTLVMPSDESEAVKLIVNSFFAVKIAFFNEARSLTDKLELDWERVLAGVLSDGRIAHSHTAVPGPDGKRGFGGKCLPKDLDTLVLELVVKDRRLLASVSRAALERNMVDRSLS